MHNESTPGYRELQWHTRQGSVIVYVLVRHEKSYEAVVSRG